MALLVLLIFTIGLGYWTASIKDKKYLNGFLSGLAIGLFVGGLLGIIILDLVQRGIL